MRKKRLPALYISTHEDSIVVNKHYNYANYPYILVIYKLILYEKKYCKQFNENVHFCTYWW